MPRTSPEDRSPYRAGPHWVAVFAAAATWPLLLVGGSVTVYRVGMAVPDWPTTFGINMFLYDFLNAPWGVYLEHSHRLFGAAVGLTCIVLAAWSVLVERRAWLKGLAAFALLAVVGQGVLGGYRVRYNSPGLALVHGCTAQAFFALMVAVAVLTGRGWARAEKPRTDPEHLRRRASWTLLLIYAQMVAGAVLRHRGEGLVSHAALAVAVWGHVAALAWRVERRRGELPELVPSARAMALGATGQVGLGIVAWLALRPFDGIPRPVTSPQALVRIGHQGLGALLLAAAVVLTLRAFRHLGAPVDRAIEPGVAVRTLEAVG